MRSARELPVAAGHVPCRTIRGAATYHGPIPSVAWGFSPRPQRSLKAATTRNAHFALLLFFTACQRRIEEPPVFEKQLLFDAAAECVPSIVSLELESNTAAMLQTAEKAGPLSIKVSPPSDEAVQAVAQRPFVVVEPRGLCTRDSDGAQDVRRFQRGCESKAVPPHPPNQALLASRRQAIADLPEGLLPADIVPVWDVVYPADVLTDLDAALSALPVTSHVELRTSNSLPAFRTEHDAALDLLAQRSQLARSGEEKACIEDKHSALQVLQSRLKAADSQSALDELARRSRLAVGAALQCGSNVGEGAVTCLDDKEVPEGTPAARMCLRYEVQASLNGTTEPAPSPLRTVDPSPIIIPTSAEVTNRVLCVRAGAEAMLQVARRDGDKYGMECLSMVLSELESAEDYLLAASVPSPPSQPSPSRGGGARRSVPHLLTPSPSTGEGTGGGGFDTPNPALMRRANELAAKAETCVATPQAPGEPPAGLNVDLVIRRADDPNAEPVSLLKAHVPAPTLGGRRLAAPAEISLPSAVTPAATPTLVTVAVAVASVPEPIVIPDLPPDVPPDILPDLPPQPTFKELVKEAVETALDPATPPPSREETEIAANVIAADFSAAVEKATEEAVPVDETAPNTILVSSEQSAVSSKTTATFTFSCSDSDTSNVELRTSNCSFECSLDSADFSSCLSPLTFDLLAEGSHSFSVRAVDAAQNVDASPASYTWTLDTTPPETVINSQPSSVSGFTTATFEFSCDDSAPSSSTLTPPLSLSGRGRSPLLNEERARVRRVEGLGAGGGCSFECSLDSAPFSSCLSPFTLDLLAEGSHSFSVRAVDAAGNLDPTPETYKWSIDTDVPDTALIVKMGGHPVPSGLVLNKRKASITFTCSDPNSPSPLEGEGGGGGCTFECSYTSTTPTESQTTDYEACEPPPEGAEGDLGDPGEGTYTFSIRAKDAAGNVDPTPATFTWTVDKTPPETAISNQPSALSNQPSATFEFSCSDSDTSNVELRTSNCSSECSLDSADFSYCLSPFTLDLLAEGSHSFSVRAVDAAGNVDESPASYEWTTDTTPPTAIIDANLPESSAIDQSWAKFALSCSDQAAERGVSRRGASLDAPSGSGGSDDPPLRGDTSHVERRGLRGDTCTYECSLDSAEFSSCLSPLTFSLLAESSHSLSVRATDAVGNVSKIASKTWTAVRIDDTAPETVAKAGKKTLFVGEEIAFDFSCKEEVEKDEKDCTFKCNGANTEFVDCTSPWTLKFSRVPDAPRVEIKAINKDGYEDQTPALVEFTVYPVPECGNAVCEQPPGKAETVETCPQDCDDKPPETSIVSEPSTPTAATSATFTFDCRSPNNTACTFECSLDSDPFQECASPALALSGFEGAKDGPHTFAVRAKNPAGIADETPAEASWTIDITGPTFGGLTLAKKQSDGTSVLLEWAAATDNVSPAANLIYWICRERTKGECATEFSRNGTTFAGATSHTVTGLSSTATYYFAAIAIDEAGNRSAVSQEAEVNMASGGGIITTVAGNPSLITSGSRTYYEGGYSGDGGQATLARLDYAASVAADPKGNLYILDQGGTYVRKVDANGIITTVAGKGEWGPPGNGGPATLAWLANPSGIAVDSNGNFYIVEGNNRDVRKVDANGIITIVAGDGTDAQGYSGDGGQATLARLSYPTGVAVDASGNLYITDMNNACVRKVDTNGIITTVAGNGEWGFSGDGGKATEATLGNPSGVAVDSNGNLYIADEGNHRIRKVDANGIITTVAGKGISYRYEYDEDEEEYERVPIVPADVGDGGPPTEATLFNPTGVAVDPNGNLYIADRNNQRIRKVAP